MILTLSAAWAADPPGAAPDPFALPARVETLDNGLVVLLLEDHRTDTVALQIDYGVGSRDELPGELGCAHLFEHLMFEGSRAVPQDKFDEWLSEAGGANNASTDEDRTVYYETFPSGALDLALFLESDRLGFLDAGLTAENLKNQQDIVLQERAEGYAEPNGRDLDVMSRLVWTPDHPYHHPVIGTVADVKGFELDAVRSFWERHYRTRNAVLSIVGNIDTEAALARVRHWFSDVPDRGAPVARVTAEPTWSSGRAGLVEDEVEERTVTLVWLGAAPDDPDLPALDILAGVLSGGHGTRLDDALYYDRPLTSGVAVYTWNGDLGGLFVIELNSPDTALRKLQKKALKEIARIAKAPPTAGEVERIRQVVRGQILDSLESPEGRAEAMNLCWTRHGTPDCLAREWARYQAVTPDDLTRVARKWLAAPPATLSTVPVGDTGALPGAVAVELP